MFALWWANGWSTDWPADRRSRTTPSPASTGIRPRSMGESYMRFSRCRWPERATAGSHLGFTGLTRLADKVSSGRCQPRWPPPSPRAHSIAGEVGHRGRGAPQSPDYMHHLRRETLSQVGHNSRSEPPRVSWRSDHWISTHLGGLR